MRVNIDGIGTLTLSEGNNKIGKILNWSLPPGKTCSPDACKTCFREGCYALKFYKMRPAVRNAWDGNLDALKRMAGDYTPFIESIDGVVKRKKPMVVRIHVSGDFFSTDYFRAWLAIAKRNPQTKFYAYTKQYEVVKGIPLPSNFSIIASAWHGCAVPKWARERLPIAHVIGHGEQVPVRTGVVTKMCVGDCTKCHLCFSLKHGVDVAFLKH